MTTELPELLPCPFCGGAPTWHNAPSTYLMCRNCGAEGPWNDDGDELRAASAWNRRAALAEPDAGAVDALRVDHVMVDAGAKALAELRGQSAYWAMYRDESRECLKAALAASATPSPTDEQGRPLTFWGGLATPARTDPPAPAVERSMCEFMQIPHKVDGYLWHEYECGRCKRRVPWHDSDGSKPTRYCVDPPDEVREPVGDAEAETDRMERILAQHNAARLGWAELSKPAALAQPQATPRTDPPACTCPSGDGSLHWPCAVHPPAEGVEAVQIADEMTAWATAKMTGAQSSRIDRTMVLEWAKRLRAACAHAEPVAWLHEVVHGDGEPDQALSFSQDRFPFDDVTGFRSVRARPLVFGDTPPPQPTQPEGVAE